MGAFASYVDVPEPDLQHHSALPAIANDNAERRPQPVRIYSGKDKPADAYVAVHYRGHWFWIDDGDWKTKRAFGTIMFFFTLGETGAAENLPLIRRPGSYGRLGRRAKFPDHRSRKAGHDGAVSGIVIAKQSIVWLPNRSAHEMAIETTKISQWRPAQA